MDRNQNTRQDLPKRPSRVHDIPGAADPFQAEKRIRAAAGSTKKGTRSSARRKAAAGKSPHPAARPLSQKEQQEKQTRKKIRRARFLLFLASFVILLLISVGVFFLNLHHHEKPGFSYYNVKIGDVKKGTSVAYKKMMRNGTLYVNLTPVLELCDIVTTGDTNELRFTTDVATDENILFRIGTREVECNGVPEHLDAPSILENGDVYVPYDFLYLCQRALLLV